MKLNLTLLAAAVIFLASCMTQHTCPTYMKDNNNKEVSKRA